MGFVSTLKSRVKPMCAQPSICRWPTFPPRKSGAKELDPWKRSRLSRRSEKPLCLNRVPPVLQVEQRNGQQEGCECEDRVPETIYPECAAGNRQQNHNPR